ncbi:MAG: succinoglycan biosynthesis transport protein ExoP [Glaciecola sp.]|jgi:succinoglycan biosynthesis transport protein ExoP
MTIIDFVRLILKHLILLIVVPLLLACMVILLTMNPTFKYSSQTTLYTGLASGSSIEMDKTFNYQATNTAFDNLINIIESRETQEEVAIRLLAMHIMLPEANPKYISKPLYDELINKIPADLYKYVEKGKNLSAGSEEVIEYDNTLFPPEINRNNYEKTVRNLTLLMKSSNNNFVYELLNYGEDKHYSLKAISTVDAARISNSDLMKLTYTTDDPGICQQTLAIYNQVCTNNYKFIKENRSDDVVKYFQGELEKARQKLNKAEDKLLEFNKGANIINYYEQSKAVAVVKEEMEVLFRAKKAELAGIQAATKRLEEKLKIQDAIQEQSDKVLEKKKQLGNLTFKIAITQSEIGSKNNKEVAIKLVELKKQTENLTNDIKKSVDKLYSYQNTLDGLPVSKVLPDWMNNVVATENLKATIKTMDSQGNDFQEKYAKYAPAGATMKRIEREISVAEQGYLEILHGLNLAKLKLQDSEMSSNIKSIDEPFFPLSPNPTKRTILIIAAGILGGILTLAIIFVMEYFDNTLKNSAKASKIIGVPALGMMPKMILDPGNINLPFIQQRLIEIITQNIIQYVRSNPSDKLVKSIIVFSTQKMEGKTVLASNIAKTLKQEGKKVLILNYDNKQKPVVQQRKLPVITKLLGYSDPRIDLNNPFLDDVASYLDNTEYYSYKIDSLYYESTSYLDILKQNNITLDYNPDYVIIELPALIYNNYPSNLMTQADLRILVCRSNRVWSEADQSATSNLLETSASNIKVIVNGVTLNEVEAILGDLPKKDTDFGKK